MDVLLLINGAGMECAHNSPLPVLRLCYARLHGRKILIALLKPIKILSEFKSTRVG
jgi:hypothetical protein